MFTIKNRWATLVVAGCLTRCGWAFAEQAPSWLAISDPQGTTVMGSTAANDLGWGSLAGRFVYKCPLSAEGSASERSLAIDPATGGIKNILVYARAVSRVNAPALKTEEPALLSVVDGAFEPRVLTVRVGQALILKNGDTVVHACLIRSSVERETHVLLKPGDEAACRFRHPQTTPVAVTCSLHPTEKAYVLARRDHYAAVTDEYGAFHIADLPGEEIPFQVWHERARGSKGGLVARPEWGDGRFRAQIPREGVSNVGTVEVDAASFTLRP